MVSKEEVIGLLFEAGVVGAGGAGFPTYYKLKAEGIDTYVINGAECEPLLFGDQYLMRKEAPSLVKTAEKIKEILGAKQVIFALKEKYKQEIKALESEGAQIFPLRDYYPAGDEVILIREVLGRTVPEGGLPLMVGVVVNNVETLYNIGRAMEGLPVTHKFVTINGAVKEPGLWLVPVGVSVEDLINACGGVTVDNPWYIEGGPMTGVYHSKPDFHVTKTTNAIIVVPTDSKLVQYETMSLERILKNARFACIQCNQCTLVCSRKLIGYNLEPHKIMRLMAYPNQLRANVDVLKSALLCSECNLCSGLHACPMQLSPRRVNQYVKSLFRRENIKPDFPRRDIEPDPLRDFRLLPSKNLLRRIGLHKYPLEVPFRGEFDSFEEVFVLLSQHTGRPCVPIVREGDSVVKGQKIGEPPSGALGVPIHAPISGQVVDVSALGIRIRKA